MEQILQAYVLSSITVTAIIMITKIQKQQFAHLMDTDFFDIVAWFLQVDTISTNNMPRLRHIQTSMDRIKENGFTLKKREVNDFQQKLWQMQSTQMM